MALKKWQTIGITLALISVMTGFVLLLPSEDFGNVKIIENNLFRISIDNETRICFQCEKYFNLSFKGAYIPARFRKEFNTTSRYLSLMQIPNSELDDMWTIDVIDANTGQRSNNVKNLRVQIWRNVRQYYTKEDGSKGYRTVWSWVDFPYKSTDLYLGRGTYKAKNHARMYYGAYYLAPAQFRILADVDPFSTISANLTLRITIFNETFELSFDPVWWDNNYLFGNQIAFNNTDTEILPINYSVNITFDHAALVTAGKAQADGDDLRIVWNNSGTWTELNRSVDNQTGWNSAATTVWFPLQVAVDPAPDNTTDYWMYYGYSIASNPPDDKSAVFLLWDDHDDNIISGQWENSSGVIESEGIINVTNGWINSTIAKNFAEIEMRCYAKKYTGVDADWYWLGLKENADMVAARGRGDDWLGDWTYDFGICVGYSGGSSCALSEDTNFDAYHIFRFLYDDNHDVAELYVDGILWKNKTGAAEVPDGNLPMLLRSEGAATPIWCDWEIYRYYYRSVPSVTLLGETSGPGPGNATWSGNASSFVTPYDGSSQSQINVTWNGSHTVLFSMNISGDYPGTWENFTETGKVLVDTNVYEYYYDFLAPPGHYIWKSYSNNTADVFNVTDEFNFTIEDDSNPLWSNNWTSVASPQIYDPALTIVVNVTCSDNHLGYNATLNWGGSVYDMSNISTITNETNFTYSVSVPSVGIYLYNFTCYDFWGNSNTSDSWNYTITGVITTCEILINGSNTNAWIVRSNGTLNLTAILTDADGAIYLSLNHSDFGDNFSSGTNITENITDFGYVVPSEVYLLEADFYGVSGYSPCSDELLITLDPGIAGQLNASLATAILFSPPNRTVSCYPAENQTSSNGVVWLNITDSVNMNISIYLSESVTDYNLTMYASDQNNCSLAWTISNDTSNYVLINHTPNNVTNIWFWMTFNDSVLGEYTPYIYIDSIKAA